MADLATLKADLEALRSARRTGVLRVRFADREVWYRSEAELQKQVASLENEIVALEGSSTPRTIAVRSEKGWL
jgi:hypothetical protein